jgi:hypothetical protein
LIAGSLSARSLSPQFTLMLGMIYGDLDHLGRTVMEIGDQGVHTSQLRRDTARCLATETSQVKEVYTLDKRDGHSRGERHIRQCLTKMHQDDPLMKKLKGRVSQICLDYFWNQEIYWDDRVFNSKGFFSKSLPILCGLLGPGGAMYLGLMATLFIQVIAHEDQVKDLFQLSLVHKDDVCEIDLVAGSRCIPDHMHHDVNVFGGKDVHPERKFGFTEQELQQKGGAGTDVTLIIRRHKDLCRGDDPCHFRFLKMTKLCR